VLLLQATPKATFRGGEGYQGYNNSTSNGGGYEGRMDNKKYGKPCLGGRGQFTLYALLIMVPQVMNPGVMGKLMLLGMLPKGTNVNVRVPYHF